MAFVQNQIGLSFPVSAAQGGSGFSTYTTGDIVYSSATNVLSKLGIGTTGQILTVVGGVPAWGSSAPAVAHALTMNNSGTGAASGTTFDGSAIETISYNTIGASPLAGSASLITVGTITTGTWNGTAIGATHGGTGLTSATTGDLIYASGSNTWANLGIGSTGQVLTVAGGVPTWAASTGLIFNAVSSSTQALVAGNTYYTTFSGQNVMTLPASAAVGTIIEIISDSAGDTFQIAQNILQNIVFGAQGGVSVATTSGVTGSVTSIDPNSVIVLKCIVANTTWVVMDSVNGFTVA